jgi:hypothetical protein
MSQGYGAMERTDSNSATDYTDHTDLELILISF